MEILGTIIGVGFVLFLVVLNLRRRAALPPAERELEDLQSDNRKMKRQQRRERWN